MKKPEQPLPQNLSSLKLWLILAIFLTLYTTCTSLSDYSAESTVLEQPKKVKPNEDSVRDAVVKSASSLLGQKPNARVTVRGREFVLDCIGTVSASWWGAGYDIQLDFPKYKGNGVLRLFKSLKEWNALHVQKEPKAGDIIFWENTYDRNEDGIMYNDGLTHAGLVVKVEDDGTVHYIHTSYTRGVVIAFCNLRHPKDAKSPQGKIWNSPMYLGSNYNITNNPPYWLSGDLWAAFGDAVKTAEKLAP
ncbi:MAG TPA: CHAP domain-containing protein [Treponemataceae bacterium]|nr:CHAP domain-containing protein [Treponemataceae bacterium]